MNLVNGITVAIAFVSVSCLCAIAAKASDVLEKDTIKTSVGNLEITFIGHGSLMMVFGGRVIHVDPYSDVDDYGGLLKADLILLTHDHGDHMDPIALKAIRTDKTRIVLTQKCSEKVSGGTVMKNGDTLTVGGIKIEAVPAYNMVNKRPDGQPFHPKGEGNGYILTFGNTRVYVAGDTENTPEMKALREIDVAFLPMNLPYTMTPEMVTDAAKAFRPKVLYPYHYGETKTSRLVDLLREDRDIEVRIRKMK
jgi:L-ascorbate metabolism protein UlaG (beta-lactamase superfamily)